MNKKDQILSNKHTNQINNQLQKISQNNSKQISQIDNSQSLIKWYINDILHFKTSKTNLQVSIPRISLLKKTSKDLQTNIVNKKLLNSLFLEQSSLNKLIMQSQHLVDIAYILTQYLQRKVMLKKIQYPLIIMQAIHNKLEHILTKQKSKLDKLLRVDQVFQFIQFKQIHPAEIYNKFEEFQLSQLREQVFLMFKFLIKPWLQRKTPSQYYYELISLVYWNLIIEDDNFQKQMNLMNLNQKVDKFLCFGSQRKLQGAVNYNQVIKLILNILSINYRKQDPFKVYNLAHLFNMYESIIQINQLKNWIQSKKQVLKPQDIENIFRNSFHIGSNILTFNLIDLFSKIFKQKKDYNILYYLYGSYIKKDYLDVVLPNQSFLHKYFDILEFYVIGFINQDRLDGQSQLDKLTNNLSTLLLRKKFNFRKTYQKVISFYRIYQARFSFLSTKSKKFVGDLERLYRYTVDLGQIHNKINKGIFRDAGFSDEDQSYYEQLNIKKTDRYRGMMNIGNTCYMNSFMQAIFMTKKFRTNILDIRDDKTLSSTKKIAYALINLFTEMSTKSIQADSQIYPYQFKNQTPQPFKESTQQHDVAEFGRIYFQSLTKQLNDDNNKDKVKRIFFNKIKKVFSCNKCKNQKQHTELVLDFILHLNKKDDSIQVSKLLGEYFLGQEMSGDNQVHCQKCKKNTDSVVVPHPVKLAEYLIITIGLFEYSGGGKKLKKPFNFQFTINFSRILPNQSNFPDQNYQLYAFIVHIGNQSQRGHYICYARNLEENPTIWYCFDDSYVTQRQIVNVSDFLFGQSETPYLLFYSTSKRRKSLTHALSLNSQF